MSEYNYDYDLEDERCLIAAFFRYPSLIEKFNFKKEYFKNELHKKVFEYLTAENVQDYEKHDIDKMLKHMSYDEMLIAWNGQDNHQGIAGYNIHNDYADAKPFVLFYARNVLENYKREKFEKLKFDLDLEILTTSQYYEGMQEIEKLTVEPQAEILNDEIIDAYVADKGIGLMIKRFEQLSSISKIEMTDLITVGATSGFGKSAFLLNLFKELSQEKEDDAYKYKCQYFNLEVAPKIMTKRLLAITAGEEVNVFNEQNINKKFYVNARKQIQNESLMHNGSSTIENLKSVALSNYDKNKINILFVDHVGLLDVESKNYSRTEYDRVTYCMKQLRNLALDNKFIIFVACQIDRASIKSGDVSMFSLKSSGEIENSSTHVILLKQSESQKGKEDKKDKEEYQKEGFSHLTPIQVDIAKNRNGSTGILQYNFYKDKQYFSEGK